MKKSIFIGGKIRELDFALPSVLEGEMRKDLTSFLKQDQEVPFMVTANSKSKRVTFLWPIHLKPDYKHDWDQDPDKIREEFVYIITGHRFGYLPQYPGYYYHIKLGEFYSFYRKLCKMKGASKFKDVLVKKIPDKGIELVLTF